VSVTWDWVDFILGAVASLATSWLLVSRLERLGERFGFSEALLGLVAALAADAPEITSAVTALGHHQGSVGIGVVLGSNVFNLAALLGLGALVAGRIVLHRRVVLLAGAVALWVAGACLLVVERIVDPLAGLLLVLAALVPYVWAAGWSQRRVARSARPGVALRWVAAAVADEELELAEAIDVRRGDWRDGLLAVGSLAVVVAASVVMERAATGLGTRYRLSELVLGGIILAAVTSLPNAVAAMHLAARGRGSAVLSEALNSNTLNVTVGLVLPAVIVGLGRPAGGLVAVWYVAATLGSLALAWAGRGLGRRAGWVIVAGYLALVVVLVG
jgi:cation:H+ antiporter